MSFSELKLVMPKDARITNLAYAIWAAGITPFSWAMQCGPDFLPRFTIEQQVGWIAYEQQMERERKREHDVALASEIARAEKILASQGRVLADSATILEDQLEQQP